MLRTLLTNSRKIVFKFGSSTLADSEGRIDLEFFSDFSAQCASFIKGGKQVVIVSSGAQAAGLSTMHRLSRKKDIHYRQALCAVGQVELMAAWQRAFVKHDLHVAQILLTREDFGDKNRTLNMRNTLFTLVDEGIIPIINENDSVCVDEIKIGDNDTLASQTAILWSADLLVLFSDIDGLFTKNPTTNSDAKFIETVNNIDIDTLGAKISTEGSGFLGTGGVETKISAAKESLKFGIPVILTRGKPAALNALCEGNQRGTVFSA
ncbi:MAG: glutamate 5-kinase [Spirochaetaceae bacterium]|jgi:glutamate 5-kinase|nr:glutamate 5-kinase [Spirochaetaceae bacterium]